MFIKTFTKQTLHRYFPHLFFYIKSIKFFIQCRNRFYNFQTTLAKSLFPDLKIKILYGPFKGVNYYNRTVWGPITPKWIGTYELELHEIIHTIIDKQYNTIIDIGAAEGYYAIGLSSKCPTSQIISYDTDPIARVRQRQLHKLNPQHKNLSINKYCTAAVLDNAINGTSLIICDIEGFEFDLIDPKSCKSLIHSDILVEIHSYKNHSTQEVKETLERRMKSSHNISTIRQIQRTIFNEIRSIPEVSSLSNSRLLKAMDEERRISQYWLWMRSTQPNPNQSR